MKKMKECWLTLDEEKTVNGKLLLFQFLTAVLAGILLGILITPFRSITIASNNVGCCANANCDCKDDEDDDWDEE